jgi:hypothetical protein
MIQQSIALQERQIQLFGASKEPELKDSCSVGDLYAKLKSDKQDELYAKLKSDKQDELFKNAKPLDNKFHVMMTIRAFAK